jgi:small subunit ribosomal protein S20
VATHKSAEKRARQTIKRTERNIGIKSAVKSAVRAFRAAVTAGDKGKITETFSAATRSIRQAASKGIMHKATASRRVGRLAQANDAAQK